MVDQKAAFEKIIQSANELFQKVKGKNDSSQFILSLEVKAKPNAKRTQIKILEDGHWQISINCPPIEGKANEELIQVLAQVFCHPKSSIVLIKGELSRQKVFKIILNPLKFNPEKMRIKFDGLTDK